LIKVYGGKMNFKIGGRSIGPGCPPYIIAELSANHNGSLKRACETIDAAKLAGADAIKLQTYTADTMTIDCSRPDFIIKGGLWDGYKLYDLYKWAETPFEWHDALFEYARKIGITIFSTPFDESSVDLLEKLNAPAYKVASFELLDLSLIRYIAKTGKPIIISTGMASEAEIEEALNAAKSSGCVEIVLLHCISEYPAPIERANVRQVINLREKFNVLAGLSDHTKGIAASISAIALGACMIEKHFTLSRDDGGPDSEFSLNPVEFQSLCINAKDSWLALGDIHSKRDMVDEKNKIFRRSLYIVEDMKAGDILTPQNLRRIRPGHGLSPKYYDSLLGKRVRLDVLRGTPLAFSHLESEIK
jgi:N-acetylneuraminate synthase